MINFRQFSTQILIFNTAVKPEVGLGRPANMNGLYFLFYLKKKIQNSEHS